MKQLVIYGAGGHAREMLQVVQDINAERAEWDVLGFLSDDSMRQGAYLAGLPILGGTDWLAKQEARPHALIAIGLPELRYRVAKSLRDLVAGFPNIVHPTAQCGGRVRVGIGIQIAAGAIMTVDIQLGDFALLNRAVNVSHDCVLGDFSSLGPTCSLAGDVQIGSGANIGMGVLANPGVRIGEWAVVGAGAVVIADVPSNSVAVGVPSRVTSMRAAGWFER